MVVCSLFGTRKRGWGFSVGRHASMKNRCTITSGSAVTGWKRAIGKADGRLGKTTGKRQSV